MMILLEWGGIIIGAAGAIGLFFAAFKGNLGTSTIQLMQSNKQAQDAAIKRLEDDSTDKAVRLNNLAGQIQVLKDVPLAQIAKSLEIVSQTHIMMQTFMKDYESRSQLTSETIAKDASDRVINYLKDKR